MSEVCRGVDVGVGENCIECVCGEGVYVRVCKDDVYFDCMQYIDTSISEVVSTTCVTT